MPLPDPSSRTCSSKGLLQRPLRRAGVSILESIAILSLTSLLLTLSVGWIHQSLKLSSNLRVRERDHVQWTRLARRFRHDAWTASDAVVSSPQEILFRYGTENEVRYEFRNDLASREGFDGNDSFAFATGTRLSLYQDPSSGFVLLGWTRPKSPAQRGPSRRNDDPSGSAAPISSALLDQTSAEFASGKSSADVVQRCQIGRWHTKKLVAGNSE